MRRLTYLLFTGSLLFAFILLQEHYGIPGRLWEYRSSGVAQPEAKGTPANSGWSITSGDHDYRVIIDVSGKGPFVSVIHGAPPGTKKPPKPPRKIAANQPPASKDQPSPAPPPTPTPASSAPSSGAKSQ